MRPKVTIAVKSVPLPLVALLVVLAGAFAGQWLLGSANDPMPTVLAALHAHPDPPAPADAPPPRRRVVIVVIDGLGADAFESLVDVGELGALPDLRAYIDVGAPSLSRAVYHVLLTGVPQPVSGIRSNAHTGRARADDLAARVRAAGGTVAWSLEAVPWFADLFGAPVDATLRGDAARSVDRMVELYESGADLIVWHLIRVDSAGHAHGAASEEYRQEARNAVRLVRHVRERVADNPDAAHTVWFVGADHGHMPGGGHGGPEREVRDTLWVGLWPERPASLVVLPTYVPATRLAATFARTMGVAPPREALGDPLPLPDVAFVGLPRIAARQHAVHAAFVSATAHARRNATIRAVCFALVAVAGAALLARRGHARALAASALVLVGAAIGFAVLGPGFTLSAIRTHASFLARSIAAMGLGAGGAWAIARRFCENPALVLWASAVPPLGALVISGLSLGRSSADAVASLLAPATGLVPAGVVAGVILCELALRFARKGLAKRSAEKNRPPR